MMTSHCFGEDYKDKFDPQKYVSRFFWENSIVQRYCSSLQILHDIFSSMEESADGKLLDFGSGPCILTVLSASRIYGDITLAEYTDLNRQALQKWIKEENDALDWSPILSFVARLEGNRASDIEQRTRNAIKEVIPCDVNENNLLLHPRGPYDTIISRLCLEASCRTIEHYRSSLKILCTFIKPGGGLILCGMWGNEDYYEVGDYRFFNLPLNKELVTSAVQNAGMTIQKLDSIKVDPDPGHTEVTYRFFMHATKEK